MIELIDICRDYIMGDSTVKALDQVNLKIEKGEFIAIMGASGSGKSTLMNILGCLDRPDCGTYLLDGIDIRDKTENELAEIRNKKIGFVFQSFNLIPRTSALKNVELPMIYAKKDATQRTKKAMEILGSLNLGDRAKHMPSELSGGQRQRVAIARALANDPDIILADEPTGNLDSKSSLEIMEIMKALNSEGRTVIIVTHEHDIADYANRTITFRDGRVISDVLRDDALKGDA
ncbi:ABC transporter ATP-binding protein [Proteocatella sphenisci]|uniref:ABC transporter ATP-binding protein n=1 Tax=Proteocatella sphenisci TaxID=181070 RepID=UPI00048FDE02|nr:ABC transporter ATP-binding protein [Proteocatella sphenisci]